LVFLTGTIGVPGFGEGDPALWLNRLPLIILNGLIQTKTIHSSMRPTLAALLLLSISFPGFSQFNDTTTLTILMGGVREAGFIKRWKNPDGSVTEWRQFNDRGRGDSTVTTYSYDQRGFVVKLTAAGVDYYKKPISEKFEIVEGIARWETDTEKEETRIDHDVEFRPGSVRIFKNYNNYFRLPGQKIHLFPSGESTLSVLTHHTLPDGRQVQLITLQNNNDDPRYVWIDDRHEFFAEPSDYHATILAGYENQNFELLKIQDRFVTARYQEMRKQLSEIADGIVIKNATLFDSKSGTVKPNTTIVIENGFVRKVTTQKNVNVPKRYKVIDVQGKFVMPGLWDNHTHYPDHANGIQYVAYGVTNIRDMASNPVIVERKKDIDDGRVIGPRMTLAGLIDGAGPFTAPTNGITTVDEGKKLIHDFARLGYAQVKLYSSLNPDWVKPLADEAKKLDLRVSGHIPVHMLAEEAVRDGFDEIQHLNMLFLNFYGKDLDTRTPLRFVAVAQKAAFFDFEDPKWKAFVSLLKEHKTVIDPTVTNLEKKFTGTPQSPPTLPIPNGLEETYAKSFTNSLKMIKVLHDNGIVILPGTDFFPAGSGLHRELANYVRAGIPHADVLKMATWTSAEVNRKSDRYGSIEPNRPADIIVIDGDPLKNIQDLEKIEMIIKDRNVYRSKDLLAAVAAKR
jgi:imidazolonepropionase-like amidohydrolase